MMFYQNSVILLYIFSSKRFKDLINFAPMLKLELENDVKFHIHAFIGCLRTSC